MLDELEGRVREVYGWSCQLTAESRGAEWSYYWPAAVRRLHTRLRLVAGALIAVVGLQGVGKSSAMQALSRALQGEGRVVTAVKWFSSGDLEEVICTHLREPLRAAYADLLKGEVVQAASKDGRLESKIDNILSETGDEAALRFLDGLLEKENSEGDSEQPEHYVALLESLLPKKTCRVIEHEATLAVLSRAETLMIDLPDYSKTDRRLMVGDLDEAQLLWNTLVARGWRGNLVIFIQKEMFGDHFFFGKMDAVEIKPFTKEQLVEAYLHTFNDHRPFHPDALSYIASLSHGIFRRFLRYLQLCLEHCLEKNVVHQPIERKLAEEAVPWEEVVKDMEEELSALFPKSKELSKKAIQAVILLVKHQGPLIQKQIAEALTVNEMDVSRIIDKLEAYGYVVRERQGNEKLVKLNW